MWLIMQDKPYLKDAMSLKSELSFLVSYVPLDSALLQASICSYLTWEEYLNHIVNYHINYK